MDESTRNLVIGSIVLVLAAMYGGDTLGSWFVWDTEVDYNDGTDSTTTVNFYLEELEYDFRYSDPDNVDTGSDRDKGDVEYGDNDCTGFGSGGDDCKELEDLMGGKIKNLLYIIIVAGFATLYFMSQGANEEMAANACLVMGGAGLLVVAMFAVSFPEALDDDMGIYELIDDDPSLFGDDKETSDSDVESDRSWRPDIAWVLVLLSGIMGMAAYADLKR
jgi:hypothetical protein